MSSPVIAICTVCWLTNSDGHAMVSWLTNHDCGFEGLSPEAVREVIVQRKMDAMVTVGRAALRR